MSYAPPVWGNTSPPAQPQYGAGAPAYPPAPYHGMPYQPAGTYNSYPVDQKAMASPGLGAGAPLQYAYQPQTPMAPGSHPGALGGYGAPQACAHEHLKKEVTIVGIVLAIVFFPIGLLCMIGMRDTVCQQCGAQR